MLTLEQQVCTLKSAQRLKELGVKQESLFAHWRRGDKWEFVVALMDDRQRSYGEWFSAFTCSELGEMLPPWVFSQRLDGNRGWVCDGDNEYGEPNPYTEACTQVECMSLMLIHLIENGLVDLKGDGK